MGYWLAKKLGESHAATQGQTQEEQTPACLASFSVVDLLWNPTWACQSTNSRVVKKFLFYNFKNYFIYYTNSFYNTSNILVSIFILSHLNIYFYSFFILSLFIPSHLNILFILSLLFVSNDHIS